MQCYISYMYIEQSPANEYMERFIIMSTLNEEIKQELDKLILIANRYGDKEITESFLWDILISSKTNQYVFYAIKDYLSENDVKIVSDNLSVENMDETPDKDKKIKPYDTSKIDISPKTFSLDIYISRLENNEIDLMPDFQRKAGLWSQQQKSQLIESLILKIPLPAFYFDGSNNDNWIVIDGLQRLTTLKEFFIDKSLFLEGLEFLADLNGVCVSDMPRAYLRRMKETSIISYIIDPGAPANLKYNIFKRINTGGLKLEPQEIRHTLFQGYATRFIKKLAETTKFKEATGYSIATERMLDREFVLRFIAFYELGVEEYEGTIDEYLNKAMELINKKYPTDILHAEKVERTFELVLDTSLQIFGKFSFRRMPDEVKRRSISKALFETWTSIMAKYEMDDLQLLVELKKQLKEKYMPMFVDDEEFYNAIGSGKVASVRKRFEKIEKLIEEVLSYAP
jgi:Protein of unknown function DUF262.